MRGTLPRLLRVLARGAGTLASGAASGHHAGQFAMHDGAEDGPSEPDPPGRDVVPASGAAADAEDLTRTIDLVRRAQGGESDALERLCARYYDRVRPIVRHRLTPALRQVVDTGDILQETFLQAVRGLSRFEVREEAELIHWLARISERQVLAAFDRISAQKRDRAREVELGTDAELPARGDDGAAAEDLAREERSAAVDACLDALPEELREVILMRDHAGGSWDWIAAELRTSASAVRRRHARALVELGRCLRAKGIR